jgi:hypothetical protein
MGDAGAAGGARPPQGQHTTSDSAPHARGDVAPQLSVSSSANRPQRLRQLNDLMIEIWLLLVMATAAEAYLLKALGLRRTAVPLMFGTAA